MNQCKAATFKRGANFKFTFKLPEDVPPGQFSGWTPTAQIRRFHNDEDRGLISNIPVAWGSGAQANHLLVNAPNTGAWPLGLAEFDVMLTSPSGEKVPTATILFDIQRGITK